MDIHPSTLHRALKSLVNKYFNCIKQKSRFETDAAVHKHDIIELLRASGKEKVTVTLQEKKIVVSNRTMPVFSISSDAANILRRKIDADLLPEIIHVQETVDMAQLQKLIEMGKVPDNIIAQITQQDTEEKFSIEVLD